jgi:pimeloyl-ACP methyl ester carboxylesterase
MNPMKPVESQIEDFKSHYQDHIHTKIGPQRSIGYAEAGDKKNTPVLFVHGSPGSQDGWYSYLLDKKLLEKFHLITVDRPGYGRSGEGESERSLTKQAEELWNVLSINESQKKVILVGHSFAGPVIAKMANSTPMKSRP